MKRILFIFLFPLIFQSATIAQKWERVNYNKFAFEDEAESAFTNKDGQLFFGSYSGVYKSEDNGKTWTYSSNGLNKPTANIVSDVYADESGIYCATYDGVYKSTDNGNNWTQTNDGLDFPGYQSFERIFRFKEDLFLFDYNDEDNEYGKIYSSSDNGAHWNLLKEDLDAAFIKAIDTSIYAWNSLSLLTSQNGRTFAEAPSISSLDSYFSDVEGLGNDLFVISNMYLYRSTSGGPWTISMEGVEQGQAAIYLYNFNDTLYVSTVNQDNDSYILYYSINHGDSWSPFPLDGLEDQIIIDLYYFNNQYIAITQKGFYYLVKGNTQWVKCEKAPDLTFSLNIQTSGNALLVLTENDGIFRSVDKGKSWTVSLDPKLNEESTVYELFNFGKFLYAQLSNAIYKSSNHGQSWDKLSLPVADPYYLNINGGEGDTLFITTSTGFGARSFISTNNGNSWTQLETNTPNQIYWGNALFLGKQPTKSYNDKLMRSSDLGQHWELSSEGLDTTNSYIDFVVPGELNTFYLLSSKYIPEETYTIYKSTDNGRSWSAIEFEHNEDFLIINDLKYYNDALYISYIGGISRSTDGGLHWESLNGDLPYEVWGTISFIKDTIYCSSYGHGIWMASANILSIAEKYSSDNGLNIYPNPASQYLTIELKPNSNAQISIINSQGQVLKEIVTLANSSSATIDIQNLDSGIYIIKKTSGAEATSQRLVIVR